MGVADLLRFLKEHKMPIPEALGLPSVRILVVDDEPALRQMISRALKSANPDYEIIEAQDGFRAGQMVATLKPNVVILDLRMPGMDGFEVCRLIKGQQKTQDTVVLAMTAYPSPEIEKRIRECGASDYFAKPLDMERLLDTVRAAVA